MVSLCPRLPIIMIMSYCCISNMFLNGCSLHLQAAWRKIVEGETKEGQESLPMPSRLVTEEDLKPLYKAMVAYEASNAGVKRKGDASLDTQHYGRGKRAREVSFLFDLLCKENLLII